MLTIILSFIGVALAAPFAPTDHCVAYEADKKMFLLKTVHIIGKNCGIESIVQSKGSEFFLAIDIPLANFKSGDSDRDSEVRKILGENKHSGINVTSTAFSREDWESWKKAGSGVIYANITVKGREYRKKVKFTVDAKRVSGQIKGRFSDYGLKPPEVGGGVVASAFDAIDLKFQLILSSVKQINLLK